MLSVEQRWRKVISFWLWRRSRLGARHRVIPSWTWWFWLAIPPAERRAVNMDKRLRILEELCWKLSSAARKVWSSPGGNNKKFKSCNDKLVITWYFKKQLTLGPFLKEKLFQLVQDKPEMTTDSSNRSTSQNENQQTTDNGADSGSENSLFAVNWKT